MEYKMLIFYRYFFAPLNQIVLHTKPSKIFCLQVDISRSGPINGGESSGLDFEENEDSKMICDKSEDINEGTKFLNNLIFMTSQEIKSYCVVATWRASAFQSTVQ